MNNLKSKITDVNLNIATITLNANSFKKSVQKIYVVKMNKTNIELYILSKGSTH